MEGQKSIAVILKLSSEVSETGLFKSGQASAKVRTELQMILDWREFDNVEYNLDTMDKWEGVSFEKCKVIL